MQPVDKRLLARSAPMRRWIISSGLLTALGSAATIAMGILIGTTVSDTLEAANTLANPAALATPEAVGTTGTTWETLKAPLVLLLLCALIRVGVAWALARFGQSAAAEVIAQLREEALVAVATSDPRNIDTSYWRTMLTVGINGLSAYISGFLPALVATAISTPIALAAVAWLDFPSFLIAVVTLPLIPLFMWLVGKLTEGRTEERLRDIGVVRGQIFDLIQGLPTLHAHGMAQAPEKEIEKLSKAHQRSSMAVLRIAFLSGMVLEFLATISVALVAVGIGFRLLDGDMPLAAGLSVLIIIAEVYGPVRAVGTRFHDAQDGLVASSAVLDLIETRSEVDATDNHSTGAQPSNKQRTAQTLPSAGLVTVEVRNFSAPGRDGRCPRDLSFSAHPGEIVVLTGENGVGKSTALLAIAGIVTDNLEGTLSVRFNGQGDGRPLAPEERMSLCTWLPARPVLDSAAVGDNSGLSLGQRHRVALREELSLADRPLVLLDEPTAHLDEISASEVMADIRQRAREGATVVISSHDPLVIAAADQVVEVHK